MHLTRSPLLSTLILGTAVATAAALAPTPAQACGGFFCSQVPIDQTGEQILFAQSGDSIEAHVNIQYAGPSEEFAWIVPTPSRPEVGISSMNVFQQLEWRAGIQFRLDWSGGDSCSWGIYPPGLADDFDASESEEPEVTVVEESSVGPYDFAVLQATNTEALFDWLQSNNYDIPDDVQPFVDPYVDAGGNIHFVAFRLQSNRDVGDLAPVRLKYISSAPMVPIQLTAIATQPDLGVTVHVLADDRAVPDNYLHVHINEARIDWFTGGSNYDEVVTEAMNEAGGQGFHTEYAGPSSIMAESLYMEGWFDTARLATLTDPVAFVDELMNQQFRGNPQLMAMFMRYIPFPAELEAEGVTAQQFYNRLEDYRDYLDADNFDAQAFADELEESVVEPLRHAQDLFDNRPYLTRMYTTLSAEEMSRDPVFAYNSDMANVDNIRTATATAMCDDTNNPEGTVLTVTLSDGRAITATIDPNWNVVFDNSAEPAAAVIEETGPTGSMPVVIYDTALGIDNLDAVLDERQRENHANRPDMVAMPTPTSGGDGGGCAVTPGSSAPMASLLVLALGLIGFHRRRR